MIGRVVLAYLALRGRFDGWEGLREKNEELIENLEKYSELETRLRSVIDKTQTERDYWYKLWFRMGTEFQAGQSALIDEVDVLRRKLGMPDADKLKELADKANGETERLFVKPEKHPSPVVSTPLEEVDCPPKNATLGDGE